MVMAATPAYDISVVLPHDFAFEGKLDGGMVQVGVILDIVDLRSKFGDLSSQAGRGDKHAIKDLEILYEFLNVGRVGPDLLWGFEIIRDDMVCIIEGEEYLDPAFLPSPDEVHPVQNGQPLENDTICPILGGMPVLITGGHKLPCRI